MHSIVTPAGRDYDLSLAIGDRIRLLYSFDQFQVATALEPKDLTAAWDGAITIEAHSDQHEICFTVAAGRVTVQQREVTSRPLIGRGRDCSGNTVAA